MKYLIPALLWLASCAAPPGESRVDIILRNSMDQPVKIRAQSGFFGRNILLAPGEAWSGWVPRNLVGREIRIEVVEDKETAGNSKH